MLDQRLREGTEAVKAALADAVPPAAEELFAKENVAARGNVGWRGPLIAVATAVVVLAVVAAAAFLFRARDSGTDPAATTIPTPESTSTSMVSTDESTPLEPLQVESLVWSRVPHDAAVFHPTVDDVMSDVVAGGPGFVAVGATNWQGDGAVWTSPDGLTWTLLPNNEAPPLGGPGAQSIESITTGGPGLVAVGATLDAPDVGGLSATVWTSEDGINWSKIPYSEAAFGSIINDPRPKPGNSRTSMRDVTEGGPGLVAVGEDTHAAAVWTSPDGITWSRVPHDPEVFGGSSMRRVAAGESGLIAIGGKVWTSPDGFNWSVVHDDRDLDAVAVTESGFVGVGGDGNTVWTSPDGVTWNRVPQNDSFFGGGADKQVMYDVATVGDQVMAVGTSVWTSPDGLTWSRIYQDPALPGQLRGGMHAVAAGPSNLVAVGRDGARAAVVWVGTPSEPPG
jgi:hypothetical protein